MALYSVGQSVYSEPAYTWLYGAGWPGLLTKRGTLWFKSASSAESADGIKYEERRCMIMISIDIESSYS